MNAGKLISVILLIAVSLGNFVAPTQASSTYRTKTQPTDPSVRTDAYGNTVFAGESHFNYLTGPQGGFTRVELDAQRNEVSRQALPSDSYSIRTDRVAPLASGPAVLPFSDEGLNIIEEWRFSLYGSGIGATGLSVLDIDQDGKQEVVAGANSAGGFGQDNYWYVLRQNGANNYAQVWVSDAYPSSITCIEVADVNQDHIAEVYVALADKTIHIYRGSDFLETGWFASGVSITSLALADANGDGFIEIILSDGVKIAAYDSVSFTQLWQTTAYGGRLAVGNVDNDPGTEIVSSSGYVLDGATRSVEWYYPASGGFGARVEVGDLDGDGIDEIIGAAGWYKITIFEADLKSPMWEITTGLDIQALTLWDVDGDALPEILYGDGQWGSIHCVDGQSHLETWHISNPEHGVTGIALGDVNSDGVLEVLWGAGYTSTGSDYLFVADAASRQIEWQSDDLDGPLSAVDAGDVDDDGQTEIVMATASSESDYEDGNILCFNGATHEIEWQIKDLPNIRTWSGVDSLRIADVDGDGRTEFVIATANLYDGLIQIYDGKTHTLERQSASYFGASMTAMGIGDVDNDGQTEIVVGQDREHTGATGVYVIVFNGATAAEEWKSIGLDTYWGSVLDVHLADTDGDGRSEIIASTGGSLYVFDGVTHVMDTLIPVAAYALSNADLDQDGVQSILVGQNNGAVAAYNGITYQLETTYQPGSGAISCLTLADVDLNGIAEWLVCQSNRLSIYAPGASSLLWRSKDLGGAPGDFNQVVIRDVDADHNLELVLGSMDALYQFEIESPNPLSASHMHASPTQAAPGTSVTYEMVLSNTGSDAFPTAQALNPLPGQVSFVPGSLSATSGSAVYDAGNVTWNGPLAAGGMVTISYQAVVKQNITARTSFKNSAQVTAGSYSFEVSAMVDVPAYLYHLPLCSKGQPVTCGDFFDNFQDPSSGWPTGEDAFMRAEYANGEYRLLGKQTGYIHLVKAPTCKRVNYVVEVDARWAGTSGDSLGLIFGLNDNFTEFYLLMVNTDYQEYALYYRGPSGFSAISSWSYHSAVHTGGSSNHLKVTRDGPHITLEVNGIVLGAWYHAAMLGESNVGVLNAPYGKTPNSDARFDNFKVIQLPDSLNLTGAQPESSVQNRSTSDPLESSQPYTPRR